MTTLDEARKTAQLAIDNLEHGIGCTDAADAAEWFRDAENRCLDAYKAAVNSFELPPGPEPFQPSEILGMLNRTWETIGHDIGEENGSAGDVLDFLVSSDGMYTDGRWNRERWEATERHVIDTAASSFALSWRMDR